MTQLFLWLHLLVACLMASLFVPPTQGLWSALDTQVFVFLNASIVGHPIAQAFWAVANIKLTDIFGALFLFGSFLLYVLEAQGEERRQRVAHLLYTLIWFEISIFCCKQIYTPLCEPNGLGRHSPTIVLQPAVWLSKVAPWTKIKDSSLFCFPADHASIVIQWCAFLWFFAGWKRGLSTALIASLFLLPRLISGAHWLSDLLVGSMAITLLALAWALCTPLYSWGMGTLYRFLTVSREKPCPVFQPTTRS